MIRLTSHNLEVEIDPDHGADVTSILSLPAREQVLFQSAWREHAQRAIDDPMERIFTEPESAWLERYRGGWQILCPTAGRRGGSPEGSLYHGEASRRKWTVLEASPSRARLHVMLETATLAVTRECFVEESTLNVVDQVSNNGLVASSFDLTQHIALGGDLLDGECKISTPASTFVDDWALNGAPTSVVRQPWPVGALDTVPARPARRFSLGWLSDFDNPVARISNEVRNLAVTIQWSENLPYAWLWQELDQSKGWPWFARTRVLGFEPSNTPTSGPCRVLMSLEPGEAIDVSTKLTVHPARSERSR